MPDIDRQNILDYAPPPRRTRPFLARPFYRDYFLSAVFVGFGLFDHNGPLDNWGGVVVTAIGGCMFIAAVTYSIAQLGRRFTR